MFTCSELWNKFLGRAVICIQPSRHVTLTYQNYVFENFCLCSLLHHNYGMKTLLQNFIVVHLVKKFCTYVTQTLITTVFIKVASRYWVSLVSISD